MKTRYFVFILVAALAAACSKKEDDASKSSTGSQPAAAAKGPIDAAQAQAIFNERCSACHGTDGTGNGPGAANLTPKPRNYRDKAWQASVTDEQIKKTIINGGAAVGKSPIMPSSPDLEGKPEVVEGLVKLIRKFGS